MKRDGSLTDGGSAADDRTTPVTGDVPQVQCPVCKEETEADLRDHLRAHSRRELVDQILRYHNAMDD